MKKLLLISLLLARITGFAQVTQKTGRDTLTGDVPAQKDINKMIYANPGQKDKQGVYYYAGLDEKPDFPGGIDIFKRQIANKINVERYNNNTSKGAGAIGLNIQMCFIIEADGSLSNIEVWNGQDSITVKEAVSVARAIKTKWTPGKYNGKAVRSGFNTEIYVPINYTEKEPSAKELRDNIEIIEISNIDIGAPANDKNAPDDNKPLPFNQIDIKPEFPGGINTFTKYITDNINTANLATGAQGRELKVTVKFTVEKDGSITNPQTLRDPGYGLGKEVERVIKTVKTKWQPGIQNSKPVRSDYILPITYKVPASNEEEASLRMVKAPDYETTDLGIEEPVDYKTVQVKPEFPGGLQNFYNYVTRHIEFKNIDDSAKGQKLSVTISFIVEKDGSMSNFSTVEDPGFGLGKEVIRVLQNMKTKWNPGIQNGKPVRSTFTFPVVISVPK